jgi:hypothetical protein
MKHVSRKFIGLFAIAFWFCAWAEAQLSRPITQAREAIEAVEASRENELDLYTPRVAPEPPPTAPVAVAPQTSAPEKSREPPAPRVEPEPPEFGMDVEPGMTQAEVLAVWDEPPGRASGHREVWYYGAGREVTFERGVVIEVKGATRVRRSRPAPVLPDLSFEDAGMDELMHILQGVDDLANSWIGLAFSIVCALAVVLTFVSFWKVYVKAGEPGWAIFVPIYNVIVTLRIAGKPWWWFFLTLIPFINIVFVVLVFVSTARRFGKGVGFGLGLFFLPAIFYTILAFGEATYDPTME